jgi:molecular chaperone GrpE
LNSKGEVENTQNNNSEDSSIIIDELDETIEGQKKEQKKKAKTQDKTSPKEQSPLETVEEDLQDLIQTKVLFEEQKKVLEEKELLLAEYEDLLKRKQAEFENYRKRTQKEAQEFKKYANVEIILDILNSIDDFERAIESTKSSRDFDALLEGIRLVEKQLKGVLENKYGVKMIEAVGKEFDPTVHEAMMMEESEQYDADTVIEDFQKGYVMHDRIIRPSKVKVAKPVATEGEMDDRGADDEGKSSEEGE